MNRKAVVLFLSIAVLSSLACGLTALLDAQHEESSAACVPFIIIEEGDVFCYSEDTSNQYHSQVDLFVKNLGSGTAQAVDLWVEFKDNAGGKIPGTCTDNDGKDFRAGESKTWTCVSESHSECLTDSTFGIYCDGYVFEDISDVEETEESETLKEDTLPDVLWYVCEGAWHQTCVSDCEARTDPCTITPWEVQVDWQNQELLYQYEHNASKTQGGELMLTFEDTYSGRGALGDDGWFTGTEQWRKARYEPDKGYSDLSAEYFFQGVISGDLTQMFFCMSILPLTEQDWWAPLASSGKEDFSNVCPSDLLAACTVKP